MHSLAVCDIYVHNTYTTFLFGCILSKFIILGRGRGLMHKCFVPFLSEYNMKKTLQISPCIWLYAQDMEAGGDSDLSPNDYLTIVQGE